MRYLTLDEVIALHAMVVAASGGSTGIRELGGIESAVAQPQMTFADVDLYPTLCDKAAALGYSLICNHPFVDGNKRIGHAAMETMLWLNGFELRCEIVEQERVIRSFHRHLALDLRHFLRIIDPFFQPQLQEQQSP